MLERGGRLVASAAILLLFGACAAVHRPPATLPSLERDGVALRLLEEQIGDTIVYRLARRALARGDRTVDVLLLSGGGQNGAYGVGFLRGWKSRAESAMPRFDLVTGISTGALQSPFALLGTDAALDTVAALYRRSADRIAPTLDWLFWLRRTGGVVKTDRFRASIASVMDTTMRRQLQSAFDEGRQLFIGTSDYDLGIGRNWDLSYELRDSVAGLARTRQLLLAASSIPGIFPPQVIDGHVHADGGVVSNVLPALDLIRYEQLAARLKSLGFQEPVTIRLWVVMNTWTYATPVVMNPASRKQMNARTQTLLFWVQQSQILQRLTELARAVDRGVSGLRLELRFTSVPQSVSVEPGADKLFESAFMARLEQVGYERARSATPWDSVATSPYVRPK